MVKTWCVISFLLCGVIIESYGELKEFPPQPRIEPSTIVNIIQFYLPSPNNIDNEDCSEAVQGFVRGLPAQETWAFEMADAWGKIPDGFFYGNIHAVGMYEECELLEGEVEVTEGLVDPEVVDIISFTGKYCTIKYETYNYSTLGESLDAFPGADQKRADLGRSGPIVAALAQPIPFSYATCMPSVCTAEDLEASLNIKYEEIDRKVTDIICTGGEDELDGFDIFVLCIVILLFALVIAGTIIDGIGVKNKIVALFTHFSFSKNMVDIFSYERRSKDEITCLHGLRAITIIWIMTCHQYQVPINFIFNTFDAAKYQDPILGQTITNGWPAVDTFFCLSGIILAYRLLPPLLEKKKVNPVVVFCNRFLRLSPTIFMLATFSATLLRFLGWGPRYYMLKEYSLEECRSYWWTDPLFVDNFVTGGEEDNRIHDCLRQCWYTAVIFQLFIVAPLIVWPLRFNWKYGLYWLGFVTLLSMLIPLVITIVNEFPPSPLLTILDTDFYYEFMTKFYYMPWCRAGPWIIGIWAGLILVKQPVYIPSPKKWHVIVGYVIAILIGNLIVLGLYRYNHIGDYDEYDVWVAALYNGFARHAWGVCIAFVVLTCHFGHAKYVDAILSWKGWRPLSRLAFCMYLVSPVVIFWWSTVLYVPAYYSYFYKLYEICGTFFVSLIAGLILSVTVERPIIGIFKSFFDETPPKEEKMSNISLVSNYI